MWDGSKGVTKTGEGVMTRKDWSIVLEKRGQRVAARTVVEISGYAAGPYWRCRGVNDNRKGHVRLIVPKTEVPRPRSWWGRLFRP